MRSTTLGRFLRGIPAAPGRVSAPAWRWSEEMPGVTTVDLRGAEAAGRLQAAVVEVRGRLEAAADDLRRRGAEAEAGILDAQALMLDDPAFAEGALAHIDAGAAADRAVDDALEPFAAMLAASSDPVFRARAADVHDVARQVKRALAGVSANRQAPNHPVILVARDLAPSETVGLDRDRVVGFATEEGSATAHTAILARALGIPAVVGVPGLLDTVKDGEPLLIDGDEGSVLLDPPEAAKASAVPSRLASDPEPAVTLDGRRVEVGCNAAGVDDARRAAAAGADGIGLLRTEFVFLERAQLPNEDEQVAILEEVLQPLGGRPVILRTLDVGADKPLPSLPQPSEMNPALGVRGLRLQLQRRPDLLRDQLRAAARLRERHELRVMFPMVSTVAEVRRVRKLLEEALPGGAPFEIGVMIEVPSAALAAGDLAREVDFFSLGTNDLAQYTFAADRTNPALAELADSLHPVLLRLIDQVVRAAHRHRRWVGICGEMASDPWAVPLLVGLGLDELSVHPPVVAAIKARIRRLDAAACARAARTALRLRDGAAVRRLLTRRGLAP